jgi:serine phosphatase RsbU (regulator of sigma subunit)
LLGDGPGLIMPIHSHGEVVAVLTMIRTSGELFGNSDLAIMEEVAARVATALDDERSVATQRATASALQAAALPQFLPDKDRLALAAGYLAASAGSDVGGDWYDAFELSSGSIGLVVGDAAGHGLEAAATMAQLRNELRAYLFSGLGPAESLASLNRLFVAQAVETFATIICLEIDPLSGSVRWSSAGHPAPILVDDSGATYLSGRAAPPIGVADEEANPRPPEYRFDLRPGDRLVMFTDGLIERRGVGIDIGLTHLMLLAEQSWHGNDSEASCALILADMLAPSHEDDVCLLIADFT